MECLLVVAHPDDECMFFGPSLAQLQGSGWQLSVLCLSTGNANGLGSARAHELERSCNVLGIPQTRTTCLDMDLLQDGKIWDPANVATAVEIFLTNPRGCQAVDMVVTFDGYGVSGHQNHIATAQGVQLALLSRPDIALYELVSIPFWAKYSILVPLAYVLSTHAWVLQSIRLLCQRLVRMRPSKGGQDLTTAPWPAWAAMRQHRTQIVWYRYLWLLFSVYTVYNRLELVQRG